MERSITLTVSELINELLCLNSASEVRYDDCFNYGIDEVVVEKYPDDTTIVYLRSELGL
jgi:hypothetical protein